MKVPYHIATLQPYVPGKPVEELERELGISGSIKLASNENPLGPSPRAVAAISEALKDLNRYPDASGFYLRRKIANKFSWSQDGVILGNGSVDIIEMAVRTFCTDGDEVIVPQGAFIMARIIGQSVNAKVVDVPMSEFHHDVDGIIAAVTDRTRIIYVDNPCNPLGSYIPRVDWERLTQALTPDTLLIADQAYFEFIDAPDYPDGIEDLKRGVNVLVLRTFSKIHGLAGLRIGYGLGHLEILASINKIRSPFNTNSLAQIAAMAAMGDDDFVHKARDLNKAEMDYVSAEIRKRGLKTVPSVTNFILVDFGKDAGEVYQKLLKQGIIARPVKNYGFPNHLRVSIGTHAENVRFIEALGRVLRSDKGKA
jgi:histidinol-phosphate aminotransferase